MKDHLVYIHRFQSSSLVMYGKPKDIAHVESILIDQVKMLEEEDLRLDIDQATPVKLIFQAYRRLTKEYGPQTVRMDLDGPTRRFLIDGSNAHLERAREILSNIKSNHVISTRGTMPRANQDDTSNCPVCLTEVADAEAFVTCCGHFYHRDCLELQCRSTSDMTIKCVSCNASLPFSDLEAALTRPQLDAVLGASFLKFVNANPEKWRYCPNHACDELYAVSELADAQAIVITCYGCLQNLCTHCGTPEHAGMTCAESKQANMPDVLFQAWKKKQRAKDCPKCGVVIDRYEGCQHVKCGSCKTHFCWTCLKVGGSGDEVYKHLRKEHGGYFDNEEVARQRAMERKAMQAAPDRRIGVAIDFGLVFEGPGWVAQAEQPVDGMEHDLPIIWGQNHANNARAQNDRDHDDEIDWA